MDMKKLKQSEKIYDDKMLKSLYSIYYWIQDSVFQDESVRAILAKVQLEINKRKNELKNIEIGR